MTQDIWTNFLQGLEVTVYGLSGVFAVLIVFYLVVIILGKIPVRKEDA